MQESTRGWLLASVWGWACCYWSLSPPSSCCSDDAGKSRCLADLRLHNCMHSLSSQLVLPRAPKCGAYHVRHADWLEHDSHFARNSR